MRQILLHTGFHKSGTSSTPHFLWANRKARARFAAVPNGAARTQQKPLADALAFGDWSPQ
tara:strand:+ start:995 stop:1174 length:180 start_codon:yes stop_codon:yes gene_type:complete